MKIYLSILIFLCSSYCCSAQLQTPEGKTYTTNVFYMCVETIPPRSDAGASIDMELHFLKNQVTIRLMGVDNGRKVDSTLRPLRYTIQKGKVQIPGLQFENNPLVEKDIFKMVNGTLVGTRTGNYTGTVIFEEKKK